MSTPPNPYDIRNIPMTDPDIAAIHAALSTEVDVVRRRNFDQGGGFTRDMEIVGPLTRHLDHLQRLQRKFADIHPNNERRVI